MGEVTKFPGGHLSRLPRQDTDTREVDIMSGGDVVHLEQKIPRAAVVIVMSEDDPKIDVLPFIRTPLLEPEKRTVAPDVQPRRAPTAPVAMKVTGRLMNYSLLEEKERAHVIRTVHGVDNLSQALNVFEDAIKSFEDTARVKGVGPGFSSVPFQEFIMEVHASYKGFHADFRRMKKNFEALQEVLKNQT